MGFILLLILILALANKPKPLTEQNSSELSASQRDTNKKINEIKGRMSNSENTIIKERQKLKHIEANPINSYKKDKSENTLFNIMIFTYASIAVIICILNTIEISTLPYWMQVWVTHNYYITTSITAHIEVLFCVMLFMLIPALIVWLLERAMSDGTAAKITPIEKFIDGKRKYLQYLERNHKDYMIQCEDDIKELKVKLYEIQEFSKKRRMIKDSL